MKKHEIYHTAQIAVLLSATIAPENKLEILRELMAQESFNRLTHSIEDPETEVI